jgi:REP element-mobilizing transposase RayT
LWTNWTKHATFISNGFKNTDKEEEGGGMPRGARLDAPGTLHHVMIRGIEKGLIVKDDEDRKHFVSRMGSLAKETGTAVYAWALMSNHAHILLRSGRTGMPGFMRRLLTGYASAYNRRHKRYGHVFQNRYKSIVCEEDPYFQKLVCYIHLNPLRAGLVHTLEELDSYPWCGHSVVMNRLGNDWQDREYVLEYFGKTEGRARKAYYAFVAEQSRQARQPELTGGGLIRSMGGWSVVKGQRKQGEWELGDERILGSGAFVQQMLYQAQGAVKYQINSRDSIKTVKQELTAACKEAGIAVGLLQSGSRRQPLPKVRKKLAEGFVEEHGLTLAETARQLGVSTSAIAKMLKRE